MKWFFEDQAKAEAIRAELNSWRGTPFHQGGRSKGRGGGTDCVGFCELVMHATGVVPEFVFPRRPEDFSPHVHNDKILDYLRGKRSEPESALLAAAFAEMNLDELMPKSACWPFAYTSNALAGDLAIMRLGIGQWHMPIFLDERNALHCTRPDGVTECDMTAPNYRDRVVAIFRARTAR